MSVFVIAEIGVNHDGDIARAGELILAAKHAAADACKFQLFRDRPEIEHLRLSEPELKWCAKVCADNGLEFMCTPFYLEAIDFIDPLVKRHKIASGFMKDKTMLDKALATGKPVVLSTGMSNWDDYWSIPEGEFDILHCVSSYPCPDEEANLSLMDWFDGYSDHTEGTLACVAAVARGAQIIEKHLTYDTSASGPDHSCSANPQQFAEMVRQIRRIEKMLGDGIKRVMPSEEACAKVWRK